MTTNRILQWTLGLCLLSAFSSQAADKIKTAKGELIINPVKHGTVLFHWDGKTVFVDPVGGAAPFKKFGTPDVVLVTDIHGDHFNKDTLTAVVKEKTVVIAVVGGGSGSGWVEKEHHHLGQRQVSRESRHQGGGGADV